MRIARVWTACTFHQGEGDRPGRVTADAGKLDAAVHVEEFATVTAEGHARRGREDDRRPRFGNGTHPGPIDILFDGANLPVLELCSSIWTTSSHKPDRLHRSIAEHTLDTKNTALSLLLSTTSVAPQRGLSSTRWRQIGGGKLKIGQFTQRMLVALIEPARDLPPHPVRHVTRPIHAVD